MMPGAAPSTSDTSDTSALRWPIVLIIVALTLLAYWPALQNGLTNWDDNDYISGNPFFGSFSWPTLQAVFTSYFKGNYHPLSVLSLSIDDALGGGSLRVHHAVSLGLHGLNTALVYFFIAALVGRPRRPLLPAISALLFGLHPLHVESVAWLSARKDVLYAAFYLGAALAYVRFARGSSPHPRRAYSMALALFLGALLSKAMAVTLAPSLILIDWALERRPFSRSALLEKLPFFALALVFGVIAVLAQTATGQLEGTSQWAVHERLVLASHAFVQYLRLFVLPTNLTAFYPYPETLGASHALSMGVFIALLAGLALALQRGWRLFGFGLLFFALNISVVLQLVPIGGALYADRYAYLPSVGLCLAGALIIRAGLERGGVIRGIAIGALGLAVVSFSYATAQRCAIWRDSETLWSDTLEKQPNVHTARLNRAVARIEAGRLADAEVDLDAAIELSPRDAKSYSYRGLVRHGQGRSRAALVDLDHAVRLVPSAAMLTNRASVRLATGNLTGAIIDLDQAIAQDPTSLVAYHNRGLARAGQARWRDALSDYAIVVRLNPGYAPAYLNSARAFLALNEPELACAALIRARERGIVQPEPVLDAACAASNEP